MIEGHTAQRRRSADNCTLHPNTSCTRIFVSAASQSTTIHELTCIDTCPIETSSIEPSRFDHAQCPGTLHHREFPPSEASFAAHVPPLSQDPDQAVNSAFFAAFCRIPGSDAQDRDAPVAAPALTAASPPSHPANGALKRIRHTRRARLPALNFNRQAAEFPPSSPRFVRLGSPRRVRVHPSTNLASFGRLLRGLAVALGGVTSRAAGPSALV
jgi:hypothetical protein